MKNLIVKIACQTLVSIVYTVFNIAYSQIIYTDIKPDTTIIALENSWGTFFIDLNRDGTDDFLLNHHNQKQSWNYQKIEMGTQHTNAEILCDASVNKFPLCLSESEAISLDNSVWYDPNWMMKHLNGNGEEGHWIGVIDKYLAVRMKIAGQWHYGWIRLDVPADAGSYTVKDYAYNSISNQQIEAGETGTVGTNDITIIKDQLKIYPNPVQISSRIIHFNSLLSNYHLRIYDLRGKLIEEQPNFTGDSYVLKVSDIKPGIYLIEIQNDLLNLFIKLSIN